MLYSDDQLKDLEKFRKIRMVMIDGLSKGDLTSPKITRPLNELIVSAETNINRIVSSTLKSNDQKNTADLQNLMAELIKNTVRNRTNRKRGFVNVNITTVSGEKDTGINQLDPTDFVDV